MLAAAIVSSFLHGCN